MSGSGKPSGLAATAPRLDSTPLASALVHVAGSGVIFRCVPKPECGDMSRPLEQLEAEVLDLPPSDRARLAQRLLASLDDEDAEEPQEVERAWEEEIRRRLEAYHAGQVQTIPASEVLAKARALLR
jgi:putative addiction module component (TIGR02574 family)